MKMRLEHYDIGGRKVVIAVTLEIDCSCGGVFRTGDVVSDPAGRLSGPVGIHSSPHCKAFDEKDLIDYMRWLRMGMMN